MVDIQKSREIYHRAFVLFLAVGIAGFFLFMIRGFLIAILLGAIFCTLLYPVYRRMLRMPLLHGHSGITSALLVLVAFIIIGIPLAFLIGLVTAEAIEITTNITPWLEQNVFSQLNGSRRLPRWLPFAEQLAPYKESILARLGEATNAIGTLLVRSGSALTQVTIAFLLDLFVMLYAMFFFFLHGPRWAQKFGSYLPLTDEEELHVVRRGLIVTSASLKGILYIGLLQGFLIGLAFMVIGIQGAAFWGTLVVILSAIPAVGPPLVWVPAVLYLYINGDTGQAIGLMLWGTFVVGLVDNILRPRIVSEETRIPDLLILLSILGGIVMFGAIGIIIGPVITAGLVTILDIYQRTFRRQLPG